MKKILTLSLLLISINAIGQKNNISIEDKAFSLYANKQFDSAVIYYEQVLESDKSNKYPYFLPLMGDCYSQLNNINKAKVIFLQCIADSSAPGHFYSPQRRCCLNLADLYMKENNYLKALEYLNLAESKFPHHKICNAGEFERKTNLNFKFSECFANLGQLDSALNYITPYMFAQYNRELIDSLEYLKINIFYIELLKKKYKGSEIRSQLASAIENMFFEKKLDFEQSEKNPKDDFYKVLCYITFLGQKIVFIDCSYKPNSWNEEAAKQFSKEYIIDYIKQTITYKLIQIE